MPVWWYDRLTRWTWLSRHRYSVVFLFFHQFQTSVTASFSYLNEFVACITNLQAILLNDFVSGVDNRFANNGSTGRGCIVRLASIRLRWKSETNFLIVFVWSCQFYRWLAILPSFSSSGSICLFILLDDFIQTHSDFMHFHCFGFRFLRFDFYTFCSVNWFVDVFRFPIHWIHTAQNFFNPPFEPNDKRKMSELCPEYWIRFSTKLLFEMYAMNNMHRKRKKNFFDTRQNSVSRAQTIQKYCQQSSPFQYQKCYEMF